MFVLYVVLGVVAIAILTVVALVAAARKHGPAIAAAQREFFARTGFRHPERAAGTVEDQVSFVPRRGNALALSLETRYVRPSGAGEPLEFHATATVEGRDRVHRQTWRRALVTPPTVRLQIADRSLSSLGKAVREMVTHSSRTWSALYPGPVPVDDPAFDRRFVVYGTEPEAVRRCLAAPGLRELLLGCAEVDLVVTDREIRFADPSDQNLREARGGTTGRVAKGLNPAPSILASIPVHERITRIIDTTRDAVAS